MITALELNNLFKHKNTDLGNLAEHTGYNLFALCSLLLNETESLVFIFQYKYRSYTYLLSATVIRR